MFVRDQSFFKRGGGGGEGYYSEENFGSEIVALPLLTVSKIVALPKFEFKK